MGRGSSSSRSPADPGSAKPQLEAEQPLRERLALVIIDHATRDQRSLVNWAPALTLADAILALTADPWRPIETAPKDGTPVLVWWPIVAVDDEGVLTDRITGGAALVCEWSGGHWSEPDLLNCLNSAAFDDDEEYARAPSLWAPLPAQPRDQQVSPPIRDEQP